MHSYSEILKIYINTFARKINLWFYAIAVKTLKQFLKKLEVNASKIQRMRQTGSHKAYAFDKVSPRREVVIG